MTGAVPITHCKQPSDVIDEDYIASFNTDGTVTVAIVTTGAAAAEKNLKATEKT